MKLRFLWPGRTKNADLRRLQDHYLERIARLERCELVETREARGIDEKFKKKIMVLEAFGLEKQIKDDYIICLFDKGKKMTSEDLARLLKDLAHSSTRKVAFVVGGFLGLDDRLLKRAHLQLSLSKMTFSHELSRIMLLEQVYRALCLRQGKDYVK